LELGIIRPSVSSWGAVNIFQGGWFLTIVYILKGFELGHNEGDPNLCMNATKYTNNHEYKDATEITLHFINIKELKFVYRHNRNKIARALVAYL